MDDKILKELKELNKTFSSVRTFVIAEAQLIKILIQETKRQGQDIQKIKSIMEDGFLNNKDLNKI